MTKGSNDLNLLLKAKVVKIKVELDYKGSGLPAQVDGITKNLENKPVKLKVKLDATIKDLNKQVQGITNSLNNSKTSKPIKLAVQIDVKGSAIQIKKQLQEVYQTVDKFNKQYGKQIKEMQQKTQQVGKNAQSSVSKQMSNFSGIADPSAYMKSLKDAEKYMKNTFGKGIFSSQELKDANGQLIGFTTALTKANGVVQKVRYDWDSNASKFVPINQQTVTQTEKNVSKALSSLRELDREIATLGTQQGKYWKESQSLQSKSLNGTLTQEAVNGLKTRIKEEQALQGAINKENSLLREQKELLAQINRVQKEANSNRVKKELGNLKSNLTSVNLDDTNAKNQIADLKSSFRSLEQSYNGQIVKEKELTLASQKRLDVLAQISKIQKTSTLSSASGAGSARYVAETQFLAKNIKTMEDYNAVMKRVNSTTRALNDVKINNNIETQLGKLKSAMVKYATETGRSQKTIESRFDQVSSYVGKNLEATNNEIARYTRLLDEYKRKLSLQQKRESVVQLSPDKAVNKQEHQKVSGFVSSKDNDALKQYISNLNNAQVSMMRVVDAGNGITRITTQFASTKKTAREVTYEVDQVDKKLRQLSSAEVFNANRNLGIFEQLKIAMSRVPVWMTAMTAFYGSIRSIKAVTNEVLALDKSLTELRRVASAGINIDTLFSGAIGLAKELGNNVQDVMQSVNNMARTFGEFNERQLLAITRTATLMSNVSELSATEATESLVGTMNAFNITAEESIRIVDSMNEVDNNYAISTKQLATGLSKSASTAKTFGVTLEENIGHVTAIGAVTMESGNIIGNSLKTIYSRITTMSSASDALEEVGVAVTDLATGDIRRAGDIIEDLSYKWFDLSDAQRQNIGVQVAGRYQLSRFLALMNNFDMATQATKTALTSQGSAVRENAQYMKSFEARINQLKNTFTELSNSIGGAVLASGLTILISGLASLAETGIKVVETFGVLPVVFAVLAPILFKFGLFGKVTAKITSGLQTLISTFRMTSARATIMGTAMAKSSAVAGAGFRGLASTATGTFTAIGAGATALFTKIKVGFVGLMASTGVGLAFVVLGFAIEKVIKIFSDSKAEQEELIKTNEKMIQSYRATGDGMESMYKKYSGLMRKKEENIELTQKEQDELDILSSQFAEQLPTVVDHYTDSGEAILKNTDKIKEQIEYTKQLSKEQAKLTDMKFSENLKEGSKEYVKTLKETQKEREKLAKLEATNGGYVVDAYGGAYVQDNTKAIQEQIVKVLELENQLSASVSDVIKVIQSQSLAYLEATGKAVSMTDAQIKLVETFASVNDGYLRQADSAEELENRSVKLTESSKNLGVIFSDAFNIMSKSIRNQPEELDKLRTNLDMVAKSIPKDFLKVDDSDYTGSMLRITQGTKEFINVSSQVKSNASANFGELTERLVKAGFTMDEARLAVTKLSVQHGNLGLRQQAQAQDAELVTQATNEMNEAMLESIDVIAEVFGYESGEFSALKQQIELMEILREKYGEGATQTQAYKDAQNLLAEALGVTSESIEENAHDYNLAFQALQDLRVVTDEQGGSYLNFAEITKGMTKEQKALVSAILEAKGTFHEIPDSVNGASGAMDDLQKSVIDTREEIKEPFDLQIKPLDAGFKSGFQDLINVQGDMRKLVQDSSVTVTQTVNDVNKSGENLGKTKDSLDKVSKSAEDLDKKTKTASGNMSTSFSDMSTTVSQKSDIMIGKYDSVSGAIANMAQSARDANREVSNMNSDVLNSMNTLSRFQSKLSSTSSSANNAKSNFIMNSYSRESLLPAYNGLSDSVSESIGTFTATSDSFSNGSSYGGGGEGTSGVIKSPTNSLAERFEALHKTVGASGGYYAYKNPSSVSSKVDKVVNNKKPAKTPKPAKTSTAKAKDTSEKAEQLAELYVIDLLNRKKSGYEATLNSLQGKIKGLSENTKEYRDSLREIREYEKSILLINQQELVNTVARNKQIDERLKKLSNTSKHTKDQREEYNKLQQEYDSNLGKIATLQGTIQNAIVDIRKQSEAVFLDFVDEIISSFDKSLDAIKGRIENLDFKLEVLELTDPDDVAGKIDILVDKTVELVRHRNQLEKERKQLEADAVTATAKYGANSDAVKKITDRLKENSKAWESVTLSILRAEKEIRDIRGEMADKIIDLIKNNYKEMEKASTTAIDNEIKALKKAHDEKIKLYDAEIKKINDIYSAKIKSLDDERDSDSYEKDKTEKTEALAELQKQEALYAKDDTLEGRKKYAEIKKEREKAQKDLDQLIKDRQLELLKEQLNNEKDAMVEGLENKKETEQESNDVKLESLEAEKDAISEHYKSITEDEKKWAKIREELIKGNFGVVKTELESMGITLDQITNGTFNTLSSNFASYSEQVRNFVIEMNNMIGQINAVTNTPSGGTHNGTGIGNAMTPYQATEVIRKAKNGIALDDPTPDKNNLYQLAKDSNIGELTLQTIFDKASKGEAMIAPTTEKQMFYDMFLEILGKKAPRFNTGGFTGDWAGNGGKMAILDKKELVLNENQTRDILDTVQLVSRMSSLVPSANRSIPSIDAVKNISANTNNTYDINIRIDKLNGDKKGADLVVKEIMKGMKKQGR